MPIVFELSSCPGHLKYDPGGLESFAMRRTIPLLALGLLVCLWAVTKQDRVAAPPPPSTSSSQPVVVAVDQPVTFARDVAPIIFARCAACHRPGEAAPFYLLTYADVRRHARQIAEVTQ